MATLFTLGGEDLYTIVKRIDEKFNDSKFRYTPTDTNDKETPSNVTTSQKFGNRVYYDMYDRISVQERNRQNETNGDTFSIGANDSERNDIQANDIFANRILINYKGDVSVDLYNPEQDKYYFYNKIQDPKSYKDNRDRLFVNPDITTIVNKLSEFPSTKLSYADFLYCKKLGSYPNNRMVILRRYSQPCSDNLHDDNKMNTNQSPISVLVTWFDKLPLDISFGETYSPYKDGISQTIMKSANKLSANTFMSGLKRKYAFKNSSNEYTAAFGSAINDFIDASFGNSESGSPWAKLAWYEFIHSFIDSGNDTVKDARYKYMEQFFPEANPNLIRESRQKTSLNFSLNINSLSFTYVTRSINGIDPHVAMHNIIANGIRMGTSTSISMFPVTLTDNGGSLGVISDILDGKVVRALTTIIEKVKGFFEKIIENVKSTLVDLKNFFDADSNDATKKESNSKLSNYIQKLLSLWRFELLAAISADTGLPSTHWHCTIGNPFNPIASIGDLIISNNVKMSFNDKLSYEDFPTEVTFTLSLTSARRRGAQEIESIFNGGRGRIYVYPTLAQNPDINLTDVSYLRPE